MNHTTKNIASSYAALCLAAVLTLLLAGCSEEQPVQAEPVRPVRTFTVHGNDNQELRTFPGTVKAAREAALAFRLSGQIVRFGVKEGDKVRKGQVIALLDQRDYQAAVADLAAQLAGARSVLEEARLNYERNKQLLEEKIIAKSAYDAARSTFDSNRARVLSLEQSLKRARLDVQYTKLIAPFSGTIAIKYVENHEYVQAKEAVVKLEDTSSLDVELDIPETLWVRAFKGGDSSIEKPQAIFESFPGRSFPLKVKEYQTAANPGTQTYKVTMTMENPGGLGIHPGMTAQVQGGVPNMNGTQAVDIPFSAVAGDANGTRYVWVLAENNSVSKREVRLGRILNDMFTVTTGLRRGETIISAGVHYLHEGQTVRPLEGRIGGRE